MRYKTVNLREETYRRLKMLQTGGKSLSDVIENLIEEVDPVELYKRELEIHRRRLKEAERTGKLPVAEVEKRLPWLREAADGPVRAAHPPQVRPRTRKSRAGSRA